MIWFERLIDFPGFFLWLSIDSIDHCNGKTMDLPLDLQARYQNRLASAKIRDYLKEQLPQQDAGKMQTMATHPEERGIYRIGWNHVVYCQFIRMPRTYQLGMIFGDLVIVILRWSMVSFFPFFVFGSSCTHWLFPARNCPWLLCSDVRSGTSMPLKCTNSSRFPSTLSSCQLSFSMEVPRLLFQQQICCSWMITIQQWHSYLAM